MKAIIHDAPRWWASITVAGLSAGMVLNLAGMPNAAARPLTSGADMPAQAAVTATPVPAAVAAPAPVPAAVPAPVPPEKAVPAMPSGMPDAAPAPAAPVAPAAVAEAPAKAPEPGAPQPAAKVDAPAKTGANSLIPTTFSGEIDIQSDSMDMDLAQRTSTFTGHVVVKEPRMQMQSDKMVVYFGKNDKPERLEAIGHVVIEQPEAKRKATAGKAEYDVTKGTIVLTETPTLKIGDNTLSGATKIIYERDTERVKFEGDRPRIQLNPKTQTEIPDLFNTLGKDRVPDAPKTPAGSGAAKDKATDGN